MGRISRGVLGLAACLIALALLPALAGAAGKAFYAGPEGIGSKCEQLAPCSATRAVELAEDGDSVVLAPGEYLLSFGGVVITHEIDFGGAPGTAGSTVLSTLEGGEVLSTPSAGATLHDFTIVGEAGLEQYSGVGERIYAKYEGKAPETGACEVRQGAILRDSVCWAINATEEEGEGQEVATAASGLRAVAEGDGVVGTATLRNVTAISDTSQGPALVAVAANSAKLTVDAANVIAHAAHHADVVSSVIGAGFPKTVLNLGHSGYDPVESKGADATVTAPGTNSNTLAAPLFVNPAAGDFHQAARSPTIDGGAVDKFVGATDLDGDTRAKPGCFGAGPIPDMGAYEFTAIANCPPPPPAPPPPPPPPPRYFKIIEVKLNKKSGTGAVTIEVPAAGTLTMTGSGVKQVVRSPSEAGLLRVPIKPWAITVVRLSETGKARVHLKLTFKRAGGTSARRVKSVVLELNR